MGCEFGPAKSTEVNPRSKSLGHDKSSGKKLDAHANERSVQGLKALTTMGPCCLWICCARDQHVLHSWGCFLSPKPPIVS